MKRRTLGRTLGCAAHLARERLDARLNGQDITPAQVHVLLYLIRCGGEAPQSDLQGFLKVKPPTMKGILDRMEERGLVERRTSQTDGRRRLVGLTERGAQKEQILQENVRCFEEMLTQGFSPEERQTLRDLLGRVIQNLEEDREK